MTNTFRLTLLLLPLLSPAARPALAQEVEPRTDRHGDPLPAGAVQRLGTLRYCQQDSLIDAFAFAPDGTTYATVANTGKVPTVRLWHTATGQEFLRVSGTSSETILHVAFAPDGKSIAASTVRDLVVWDLATGKRLQRFELPQTFVHCLAWSPDGQVLAVGCERTGNDPLHTIRLLDAATGKLLREIHGHESSIKVVVFSPDGKRLASSSADRWLVSGDVARGLIGDVRLWDVPTGKLLRRLERGLSRRRVAFDDRSAVSFSRDLARVAFRGPTDQLEVWDLERGTRLAAITDIASNAAFALLPGGRQVVTARDGWPTVFWDADTGRRLRDFEVSGQETLHRLATDPTGTYLALCYRTPRFSTVRLWSLPDNRELTGTAGHQGAVTLARPAAGKRAVTAAADGTVRYWDTDTGQQLHVFSGYDTAPRMIAFSADGTTLAALAVARAVHRLDLATGKTQVLLAPQPEAIKHLALAPDGRVLAVCRDDEPVALLDAATGKAMASLPVTAWQSCFVPDGQTLVTLGGWGGRLQLWQVSTGQPLLVFQVPPDWWVHGDEFLDALLNHRTLTFSADGRWLVVCQAERDFGRGSWLRTQLFVWEVASGRLVRHFDNLPCDPTELAVLPGSWTLAVGNHPTSPRTSQEWAATFWDLRDGRFLGRLRGHPDVVSAVGVSPDGQAFVTGGTDHTALVWEAASLPRRGPVAAAKLTARQLHGLWEDLAGSDARRAFDALLALQAAGEDAIAFLQKRLRTVPPLTAAERRALEQLVADLDDPRYAVRARASSLLEKHGDFAVPVLRQALKPGVPVETRRRVELLLARLDRFTPPAGQLRELRALAVLEYLGTPQARAVVEGLAAGAPEARLTQQARATLERLHPTGSRRRWLPG
jgi:WD40 repeat protein